MAFDQADRRRSGDSGRTGPVPSPVRPPGTRPPCATAGTSWQPQGKMQDEQGRGAASVPVMPEAAVHRGGGLRRPVPWKARRGLTQMQAAKTSRNDVLSVFFEGSSATPRLSSPARSQAALFRLTHTGPRRAVARAGRTHSPLTAVQTIRRRLWRFSRATLVRNTTFATTLAIATDS